MFEKKMKRLTLMFGSAVLAGLLILGAVALSAFLGGKQTAQGQGVAYASGEYRSATEQDFTAMKKTVCAVCGSENCYDVSTPIQLAAVMKYGDSSAERLSACYRVTFQGNLYLSDWVENGVYAGIGRSQDQPFCGHIDFNGITLNTSSASGYGGLIPYASAATIQNGNILHTGREEALGQNYSNVRVSKVNIQASVGYKDPKTDVSAEPYSAIFTETAQAACVFEDCTAIYGGEAQSLIYNHAGFVVNGTDLTIANCKVLYDSGMKYIKDNAGIVYNLNGGEVRDCSVTMPQEESKTFLKNYFSGVILNLEGNTSVKNITVDFGNTFLYENDYRYVGSVCGIVSLVKGNSTAQIANCRVYGKKIYANIFSGVAGDTSSNTEITSCYVSISEVNVRYSFGGFISQQLASTALNILTDCEVVVGSIQSHDLQWGYGGGLVAIVRSGSGNLMVQGCRVYVNSMTGFNEGSGRLLGYSYSSFTLTVKGYTPANGTLIKTQLFVNQIASKNRLADLVGGATAFTFIAENMEYIATVGRPTYPGMNSGSTANIPSFAVTGDALTAAQQAITDKVAGTSSEQGQPERVSVEAVASDQTTEYTVSFDAAFAGCEIGELYVSLAGDNGNAYTQLVYGGTVVGYMGTGFSYGNGITVGSLPQASGRYQLKFTAAGIASENDLNRIFLRLTLRSGKDVYHMKCSPSGFIMEY